MFKSSLFLVIGSSLLIAQCSMEPSQNASSPSEIVFPNGTGSDRNLIWADGDKFVQGNCKTLTPTRANCSVQVSSRSQTDVESQANENAKNEISKLVAAKAAEITKLKNQDPTVISLNAQLAALRNEAGVLQKQITALENSIKSTEAALKEQQEKSAWYAAQIVSVEKALEADPQNHDLLRLREEYYAAKLVADEEIESLTLALADDQARLAQAQPILKDVTAKAAELSKTLEEHLKTLVVRSPELDKFSEQIKTAEAGKAAIKETLDLIRTKDIAFQSALLNEARRTALGFILAGWAVGDMLKNGNYKVETGYKSYCNQGIRATYQNSTLTAVVVSFLSPCSGGVNMTCSNQQCAGTVSGYRFTLAPMPNNRYEFTRNGADKAVFLLQSAN